MVVLESNYCYTLVFDKFVNLQYTQRLNLKSILMNSILNLLLTSTLIIGSCGTDDNSTLDNQTVNEMNIDNPETGDDKEAIINNATAAKILSVTVTGEVANYTFNVEVSSPDTGCDQYADWWEIIAEDGTLVYRRILAHSHVTEQPFIRSGSAINVTENQTLTIRAHMNNLGYGTQVFKGSISSGFSETTIEANYAPDLASQVPLPDGCAF